MSSSSVPSICSPRSPGGASRSRRSHLRGTTTTKKTYKERLKSSRTRTIINKTLACIRKGGKHKCNVENVEIVEQKSTSVPIQVRPMNYGKTIIDLEIERPLNFLPYLPPPREGFAIVAVIPSALAPGYRIWLPIVNDHFMDDLCDGEVVPLYAFTVKSMQEGDLGVIYYVRGNETFQRVYNDYAKKCDRLVHEIMIATTKGSYIDIMDTPMGLQLSNAQELHVISVKDDYNLNTRVKHFYLREHVSSPSVLKISVDINARFCGLFTLYSEYSGNMDTS